MRFQAVTQELFSLHLNNVMLFSVCMDAQGIEDSDDVDDFLKDGAQDGWDVSEGGKEHKQYAESDADKDSLPCDGEYFLSDVKGFYDTFKRVDGNYHIGSLGRGGGSASTDGDTHTGFYECGCVIDTVTHHNNG